MLSTLDSTDAFWVEGIATVTSDLELSEEDGLMIYLKSKPSVKSSSRFLVDTPRMRTLSLLKYHGSTESLRWERECASQQPSRFDLDSLFQCKRYSRKGGLGIDRKSDCRVGSSHETELMEFTPTRTVFPKGVHSIIT